VGCIEPIIRIRSQNAKASDRRNDVAQFFSGVIHDLHRVLVAKQKQWISA
jgi:hypothetical protein